MWAAAQVTFAYVITTVPCVVCTALALAIHLNRGLQFLPVYRALFYMPSLIGGSVTISLLCAGCLARWPAEQRAGDLRVTAQSLLDRIAEHRRDEVPSAGLDAEV